jgi:hypothetical protein
MPRCRNRECYKDYSIPFGSLWGKSYSFDEKEIRKTLCPSCINIIAKFIKSKPADERGYWECIDDRYFCWGCKRINLSFDGSGYLQDDKKFCSHLHHIDEVLDDGGGPGYPGDDGC